MFYFILKSLQLRLAHSCRPIYCILFARGQNSYKITRYVCRFLCGCFFAWFFWEIILLNFSFSFKWRMRMLFVLIVFIGLGYVFSTRIKSVTLLILVGMIGKSGRSFLRALSFAYIIAGPVSNLSANGKEVVRVFTCSTMLQYNLTKTRFDLMTKPFQNTLAAMKGDIKEVQHTFAEIKNVLDPLRNEVESDDLAMAENSSTWHKSRHYREARAKQVQQRYSKKFELRCKQQLAKGEQRCKDAFLKAREKCMNKFPLIIRTLLCWPFRVDFICNFNILGDPDRLCDPSDALPSDFGESYVTLEQTEAEFVQDGSKVAVNYTVHNMRVPENLMNADQTAKSVMKEFEQKKTIFDHVMSSVQRGLSLLILRIVFSSIAYQKKYRNEINHDNMYISEYFKHLDERRKLVGKRHLMPLKKFEMKNLVDLDKACAHSRDESKEITFHFLQFALEILSSCFFLVLDYMIVTLLQVIRAHSAISYVQEGEHKIQFHINGTGLMARLMRSTLKNFNMNEHVHTFLTNEPCLPNANVLPQSFYIKLGLLYLTIIILIYKSAVFLRLRRLVCAYFYRKQEKNRILYLYNSIKRQRRFLFEKMYKHAKENIAKQKIRRKINLILKLRLRFPKCFDWLKIFKVARRKCLICEAFEDKLFVACGNTACGSVYCDECWHDLNAYCLLCNRQIKIINILNFQDFFEVYSGK